MEDHKIVINTKKLAKALKIASQFCGKNNSMPIMDCILAQVSDGKIQMMSSDMESYMAAETEIVSADENISFCVNGKDIMKVVSLIRDENTEFQVSYINMYINIVHSKGTVNLPIYKSDEYMMYKTDGECQKFSIKSSVLVDLLQSAKGFVGNDPLRPVMTGIYISVANGVAETCATNAHTLITNKVKVNAGEGVETSMIIAGKTFQGIIDIAKSCDTVNIGSYNNMVIFSAGEQFAVIRKVEGVYVRYQVVIPDKGTYDKKYTFDKKEFMDAVERCGVSSPTSMLAKMMFSEGTFKMQTDDVDFAKRTTENIDAEGEGDITLGANLSFLKMCTGVLSGEKMTLEMKEPSKAIFISDDSGNDERTIILMPAMLS